MRRSIKTPIEEIFVAWRAMQAAVEAHLEGDSGRADALFREAHQPALLDWLYPACIRVDENVVVRKPEGDTRAVPKADRDPLRDPTRETKEAVLKRDGYRCRYCGIPVVHPDIRKIAAALYPSSVIWHSRDPMQKHAGFQCLWMQFDHVVPHSHGGRSSAENVVITCALCNYAKDRFTLRQLDLEDPRLRAPEPSDYDGLERLRACAPLPARKRARAASATAPPAAKPVAKPVMTGEKLQTYFLPGGWISKGYLFTPVIDGKERWFELTDSVLAEPAERDGIKGCLLTCKPDVLTRRGMDAGRLLERGDAGDSG